MTDYISFPSNGNFLAKLDFCFHYYQQKKKKKKKNSWDVNLKNNLWLMHYQDWVKMSCHWKENHPADFIS